ncbi:MAG: alpha-pore-forming cytotoxin subunit MakE [Solirubrobacterales bacterium]
MSDPFDGKQVNAQLDAGLSGVAQLNASCQAVIQAEIEQVKSDWWEQLNQELGAAEKLVVNWRQGGALYFGSEVVGAVSRCASAFLDSRTPIEKLFEELAQHFDPAEKEQLVERLRALQPPVAAIAARIGDYLERLATFEREMSGVQQRMQTTVAEVQAKEAELESTIKSINAQIKQLSEQAQTAREAIAKARSERTAGIFETIFGIVFAPVTGGLSLVIAGIGVASITEAEGAISHLESQISGFQQTIAGDQATLSTDQQIVATLQSLTMSTGFLLKDLESIGHALDALRTTWVVFGGELKGVIEKLESASDAASLTAAHTWYIAACHEWQDVADHVAEITNLPVATDKRRIG